MIRIHRPEAVPRNLENKGKERTVKDCADYDADPEAYHSGEKKFSIVKSIYGTQAIKRKLLCQRRSKSAPLGRRKNTPLLAGELVHVVHGRDLWAHVVKRWGEVCPL